MRTVIAIVITEQVRINQTQREDIHRSVEEELAVFPANVVEGGETLWRHVRTRTHRVQGVRTRWCFGFFQEGKSENKSKV